MKTKTLNQIAPLAARPVAVYARVSSEEQTKGSYPSCESQVEELVAACKSRGWEIKQIIKDEGFSAGSLKRPGLSELRTLVESEQITAIVCTWYDRLTRSRDFYVLDSEFQKHGVQFVRNVEWRPDPFWLQASGQRPHHRSRPGNSACSV